jgi:flavin-dependent dehydrogenase
LVKGVHTERGELIRAELVVDASGRRSRAARWLAVAGARPPLDEIHACHFVFWCRQYRLRAGMSFPSFSLPITAELPYATVIVFPADNGTFALSLVVALRDPFRQHLRHGQFFDRFLNEVPLTAPWVSRGEPISEPSASARLANRWRRLTNATGPVVAGFVLVGDAAIETSPTFGRGASFALAHAQQLARTGHEAVSDPIGFVERFENWTTVNLGVWFQSQIAADRMRDDRFAVALGFGRTAPLTDPMQRLLTALDEVRGQDKEVQAAAFRAFNLLDKPDHLLRNRTVLRRLCEYLHKRPALVSTVNGPDRAVFERLVTAGI